MPKLAAVGFALLLASCAGGVGHSPPVSVSVTPTAARVHVTNRQQFTATVHNSSSQSVAWEVSGSECDGISCGLITAAGLYTAPSVVPSHAEVTITARAAAGSGKSATAVVTVLPAVEVTVSPVSPNVRIRQTQQFTVTVRNAANPAVTWTVTGTGCEGTACGTVDVNGLYTAPAALPSPATVTVSATSVEDSTKSDAAAVMIVPALIASAVPPGPDMQQCLFKPQSAIEEQAEIESAQRRGARCAIEF